MTRGSRTAARTVLRTAMTLALFAACHRGTSTSESRTASAVIPRDAARFSIGATSDSTVTFSAAEATWLRVGMRGHAVDPARRDALIARLTIVGIDTAGVVATITGQVSQVGTSHVVLIAHPALSWWRSGQFWKGAGAGVAIGAAAALVAR